MIIMHTALEVCRALDIQHNVLWDSCSPGVDVAWGWSVGWVSHPHITSDGAYRQREICTPCPAALTVSEVLGASAPDR